MQIEKQLPNIDLFVPELREEDIVTYYAQLRPYRQGGPRVEKETLHTKNIIHNYGHGGAGISLAPATSHEAVELAKQLIKPGIQVAVIGSGVTGLLTAYILSQNFGQIAISIYAQQIPKFGNKINSDLITSEVAPGYWLPYDYGLKDKEYHNRLSNFAFKWYEELSKKQKFSNCIRQVQVYSLSDSGEYDEVRKLTENLKHTSKEVDISLNGKIKTKAHVLKTLKIDMQPFLNIISEQLRGKNVRFVNHKVTLEILPQMKQNILFNCSGLGSRQLFGDTKMKGLKGHLIEYRNIDPTKYNYFLKVTMGNSRMAYYMHPSRILIGLVVQHQETRTVNEKVVKDIKNVHNLVLQKLGLRQTLPKL